MRKLKPGELVEMIRVRTEKAWADLRERERVLMEDGIQARITGGDRIERKIPLWEVPFKLRHPRWRWFLGLSILGFSVVFFVAGYFSARLL